MIILFFLHYRDPNICSCTIFYDSFWCYTNSHTQTVVIDLFNECLFKCQHYLLVPSSISNIHKVVKARNGSMPLALAMLYPFIVLVGGVLVWDYLSPSDILGTYPHLAIIGTGLIFGYLVGRMILAHLCDEPKGLKTGMCMVFSFSIFGYFPPCKSINKECNDMGQNIVIHFQQSLLSFKVVRITILLVKSHDIMI
ncbi:PREDICTED: uncharacterized protein LOC109355790 [Lupinus angustifolius]|uniref:uncharacterized protein LOC109355790 n=1 Tax=Lupinus angustifolius TaxID=3871 RepID=UPI00092FAD6D|nr:PREDICTED: uncharacterized protein LOC109355790 [Lupinus angustifolius]